MGVASSDLIARSFYDDFYKDLLFPCAGHLLEIDYPVGLQPLTHGLMEALYTRHYCQRGRAKAAGETGKVPDGADVTFTATTSQRGTLLLGTHLRTAKDQPPCVLDDVVGPFGDLCSTR
jgi:hypothetical protein